MTHTRNVHVPMQDDDVRKYVNTYRRSFETKTGKKHSKTPKIQRLITPLTLQRKRRVSGAAARTGHDCMGVTAGGGTSRGETSGGGISGQGTSRAL